MCWSLEVSMAFAGVEVFLLCLMWHLEKSREYTAITPVLVSVIVVEFSEAVVWYAGVPSLDQRLAHSLECPVLNQYFTTIAAFAVMTQPISMVLYAYTTYSREAVNGETLTPLGMYLLFLGTANFVSFGIKYVMTQLFIDEAIYAVPAAVFFSENATVLQQNPGVYGYTISCSYHGEHGHLFWQWGVGPTDSPFQPNYMFIYAVSLFSAIFLIADAWEGLFFAAFFSMYFSFAIAWGVPEAGSTWCWTGTLVHLFYVVYPNFLKDMLPQWNLRQSGPLHYLCSHQHHTIKDDVE